MVETAFFAPSLIRNALVSNTRTNLCGFSILLVYRYTVSFIEIRLTVLNDKDDLMTVLRSSTSLVSFLRGRKGDLKMYRKFVVYIW